MKRLSIAAIALCFVAACSNATDGDANTDTTTLKVDTGGINSNDTANHVNSETGEYPKDTAASLKGDVRSSSSSEADGRLRGSGTGRDTTRRQ
jgi:hypothetical protein